MGKHNMAVYRVVLTTLALLMLKPAFSRELAVSCKPVETMVWPNRIHVRCNTAIDNRFWFFATPTSDPKVAARNLSIMESAQIGDRTLTVFIDPDDVSGNDFGCHESNCRRIIAIALVDSPIQTPTSCDFDTNRQGCPGFCQANPDSRDCPQFCSTHPNDPECRPDPIDPCDANPRLCKKPKNPLP